MENQYTMRSDRTSATAVGTPSTEASTAPRRRSMEIHLPLMEREDRAGGSYYIAAEVPIDQNINLGDYVALVLLGKKDANGHGPGPRIVFRPRDVREDDER